MGRRSTIFLASLVIACWSGGWALGQDAAGATGDAGDASQAERRVRRLGDVEGDDYEFDLALPTQPRNASKTSDILPLGDPELEARLQKALGILAVRQGDRQAQAEVNAVLEEVLEKSERLMKQGDLEQARQLLNTIRQVEPNKHGLSEAWERLAKLQESESARGRSRAEPVAAEVPPGGYVLPNPVQAERLGQLLDMIAARPGNTAAIAELGTLLDDLLDQSRAAMQAGDFETAESLLEVVRKVHPQKRGLAQARRLLQQTRNVDQWLGAARKAEQEGALVEPRLESAYYWYRRVLAVDSDNRDALRGLRDIQQATVVYALDAARNFDFELADAWLEEASRIREDQSAVVEGRKQVEAFRQETAARIDGEVVEAIRAGDYDLAEFKLIDLIALGGFEARVAELRTMMTREARYGQYEPGQVVRDALTDGSGYAPAVVVIGSGSFLMGSREDEEDHEDNEAPAHRVSFERGFGLGVREVTVGQFRAFVRATGYRTEAEREGSGSAWDEDLGQLAERDGMNWRQDFMGNDAPNNLPVIRISWNDAMAYVAWLSERTGHSYRLPSEAEFEYALRAGTRSAYWWGDGRPREAVENLAGDRDESETGRHFSSGFRGYGDGFFGPAPVGSFEANPWGLHDMAGNVSEWVQDCWHANYLRAPGNGQAWENPGCDRRVVRGGYWASAPSQARSAARLSATTDLKTPQVGFRVARDLW